MLRTGLVAAIIIAAIVHFVTKTDVIVPSQSASPDSLRACAHHSFVVGLLMSDDEYVPLR